MKINMKKYIVLSLVIVLFLGVSVTFAKAGPNNGPFQAVWNAIAFLQEQIYNIELVEGPEGPQGEQGEPGEDGQDGTNGQNGIDGQDGISLRLEDANGQDLGIILDMFAGGGGSGMFEYHTYLQDKDVALKLREDIGTITRIGSRDDVYFVEANCQGQAYALERPIAKRDTTETMLDGTIYRGTNIPGSKRLLQSRKHKTQACNNFQPQYDDRDSYEVDRLFGISTPVWPLDVVEQ